MDINASVNGTMLSDNEIKTLRKATRIIAKLQDEAIDNEVDWRIYQAVGTELDRIILDQCKGRIEP